MEAAALAGNSAWRAGPHRVRVAAADIGRDSASGLQAPRGQPCLRVPGAHSLC